MSDQIITYKYRIKDSTSKNKLKSIAGNVNYIWNFINNLSYENIKKYSRFLSEYDINGYLTGTSKELAVHSTTPQEISKVYVKSRKQSKKNRLNYRTAKYGKSLGWIPFKASAIKIKDDTITYNKMQFRFYKSREIPFNAKIKTGCFVQDSRDRWYICIQVSQPIPISHINSESEIGIDLGIRNKITLSDGTYVTRPSITKQYEKKLASAQRANKKKLVRTIYAKIKNVRENWTHQETAKIAKKYSTIYIGDVSSAQLAVKDKKNKSGLYDAAIGSIQNHLMYKASKLGGFAKLVPEYYTTQTCSSCLALTGPSGERDLGISKWECSCGVFHDRDINAAQNVYRIGHYTP